MILWAFLSWPVVALLVSLVFGRAIRSQPVVRPCPMCESEDWALDDDGVALCFECRCSFEMVRSDWSGIR